MTKISPPSTAPETGRSPEAIARYYDAALARHGDTAQGAGWPNEADRVTRFEVMAGVAKGDFRGASLCDVACGTGAFLTHLAATGRAPARYLGTDISQAAIAEARAKHPGSEHPGSKHAGSDHPARSGEHMVNMIHGYGRQKGCNWCGMLATPRACPPSDCRTARGRRRAWLCGG